jgi:hypothetical protein
MKFKDWMLLNEVGHIVFDNATNFTVMRQGKLVPVSGVAMIDPKFELSNIPLPPGSPSKAPKFMGEVDFSLPVFGPGGRKQYLYSKRMATMSGSGNISGTPIGYEVPDPNWADKAEFIDRNGMAINLNAQPIAMAS